MIDDERAREKEIEERFWQESRIIEKTIKLNYGMTDKVMELVAMYSERTRTVRMKKQGGIQQTVTKGLEVKFSESLGWIRVSGDKDRAEEFEVAVREVDVKPQNVMWAFYLVRASEKDGDVQYPEAIEPAIRQLASTFQYGTYQLIDTALLRGRDGSRLEHSSGISLSKIARDGVEYINGRYEIEVGNLALYQHEGQEVFAFEVGLRVDLEKPMVSQGVKNQQSGFQSQNPICYVSVGARMESSVDIREGQSVVLGKSNFDDTDDALFVIVQAHAVD